MILLHNPPLYSALLKFYDVAQAIFWILMELLSIFLVYF